MGGFYMEVNFNFQEDYKKRKKALELLDKWVKELDKDTNHHESNKCIDIRENDNESI
jgi:hypothetical protein